MGRRELHCIKSARTVHNSSCLNSAARWEFYLWRFARLCTFALIRAHALVCVHNVTLSHYSSTTRRHCQPDNSTPAHTCHRALRARYRRQPGRHLRHRRHRHPRHPGHGHHRLTDIAVQRRVRHYVRQILRSLLCARCGANRSCTTSKTAVSGGGCDAGQRAASATSTSRTNGDMQWTAPR